MVLVTVAALSLVLGGVIAVVLQSPWRKRQEGGVVKPLRSRETRDDTLESPMLSHTRGSTS